MALAAGLAGCEAGERSAGGPADSAPPPAAETGVSEESLGALGYAAGAEAPRRGDPAADAATPRPAAGPRKLVRTVQLVLTVGDAAATAERVEALVEQAGGYLWAGGRLRREAPCT